MVRGQSGGYATLNTKKAPKRRPMAFSRLLVEMNSTASTATMIFFMSPVLDPARKKNLVHKQTLCTKGVIQ